MTERDLWLVIYLAIVLCVLGVLWAIQCLATSGPPDYSGVGGQSVGEAEYEKHKQWARKQLSGRSTM